MPAGFFRCQDGLTTLRGMPVKIPMVEELGGRIRRLRRRRKLTQEALAEISGYSPGYIGSVENARKVPSMEFVFDVAEALGTSPSDLLIECGEGPDREKIKAQIKQLVDQL